MSDFFSDDFTAELRSYFLNSIVNETQDFLDLIDTKIWKRISAEANEKAQAWAVDAKTNEFLFLTEWLSNFGERTQDLHEAADLKKVLEALKDYATTLLTQPDSADLANKFSQVAQNTHEILFLHCKSGPQEFAIPILNVVEICSGLPLYPLPDQKFGILGVVPFRGEALPVVNLQDHGFRPTGSENIFYLICEHLQSRFGLQVTGTEDLLNIKETDLQDVGESSVLSKNLIKKFFLHNSRSVMILDIEKLVA